MMFSFTPIVVHVASPSVESISTRVTAPVPLFVSTTHLVVGQVHPLERREPTVDHAPHRPVQRVADIALLGRDVSLAMTLELHRRFGHHCRLRLTGERVDTGQVVGDHSERLDLEPLRSPASDPAHQQLSRAVRRDFEVVALVLELLELLDDLRQLRTIELRPISLAFITSVERPTSSETTNRVVPDQLRRDMLSCTSGRLAIALVCNPALCTNAE